jgi:hypothetical protein
VKQFVSFVRLADGMVNDFTGRDAYAIRHERCDIGATDSIETIASPFQGFQL